jgi:hypothetical protein
MQFLEGFLVSDPPLQQVIARTREAGLRGHLQVNGWRSRLEARAVPHRQLKRHHPSLKHSGNSEVIHDRNPDHPIEQSCGSERAQHQFTQRSRRCSARSRQRHTMHAS